jgi:hypothetical protein
MTTARSDIFLTTRRLGEQGLGCVLRHHYALRGLPSAALEGPGQATVASLKELFCSCPPLFQRGACQAVSACVRAGGGLPSAARRPVKLPPRPGLAASTSGRRAAPASALCVPAAEARASRALWRRRALGAGCVAGRRARTSAARVRTSCEGRLGLVGSRGPGRGRDGHLAGTAIRRPRVA